MKKRVVIRTISFVAAFAVFFAASGMILSRAKAIYEDALGRVRLSGLTSLCEYVHTVSGSLRIVAVSSDEKVSEASGVVIANTAGALGSLSCFESENTKNIGTFLNGVSSFAEGFSDKISAEQRQTALDFSDYAQELYYHLSDIANAVVSGEYSLVEAGEVYRKGEAEYFEKVLDFSNGKESELFSSFADATSAAIQTSGKNEVSVQQAKEKAGIFSGTESRLLRFDKEETVNGMPAYRFYHNETVIDVCRYGGEICRVTTSHLCIKNNSSVFEAKKTAEKLMDRLGCADYDFVYSETEDFSVKFVMAPVINGVLFLPAAVTAEICLGECGIISFDASGFLLNYPAELDGLKNTEDISLLIPENLILQKTTLCCVDFNEKRKYCYLAECILNDEKVWIFIDYFSLKTLKTVFM